MADDRLDDAIAAVARAVDRIEAATRGVADAPPLPEVPEVPRQPRMPPPPAFTATDLRGAGGFAARPTTSLGQPVAPEPAEPEPVAPEAVEPEAFDESQRPAPSPEPHDEPSHDLWHEETFYEPEPAFEAPVPPFDPRTPPTPPVPTYDALAPSGDDDLGEVHELVGRIVARTQHLEDQLELARHLRFEITELVRRLAAAVERDR